MIHVSWLEYLNGWCVASGHCNDQGLIPGQAWIFQVLFQPLRFFILYWKDHLHFHNVPTQYKAIYFRANLNLLKTIFLNIVTYLFCPEELHNFIPLYRGSNISIWKPKLISFIFYISWKKYLICTKIGTFTRKCSAASRPLLWEKWYLDVVSIYQMSPERISSRYLKRCIWFHCSIPMASVL